MTTRAYVPNADGEGSIGTTDKKWGAMSVASPDSTASDDRVASTAWVQSIVADAMAKQKTAYEQAISTAVTAAKTQAKLDAHPVGSYYWSNDSTSPATLFGGTWEALPPGYTRIAQGSGSDSSGSVSYLLRWNSGKAQSGVLKAAEGTSRFPSAATENISNSTISIEFGKDTPHENLPPCIAAYGWKRTA